MSKKTDTGNDTGIEKVEGNTIVVNDVNKFTDHLKKQTAKFTEGKTTVTIKKAKIKDDLFLEGEYNEDLPGHSKKNTKFSCTVPVHDDLKEAFQKLHVHLAIIADQEPAPKKKDFSTTEFENFSVGGFSVGGADDNEGITISGSKEGKYGLVNLNTPFTKYAESEYPFIDELGLDIQMAVYEVEQYLFHEKRAPEKQLEMDFEDPEDKMGSE